MACAAKGGSVLDGNSGYRTVAAMSVLPFLEEFAATPVVPVVVHDAEGGVVSFAVGGRTRWVIEFVARENVLHSFEVCDVESGITVVVPFPGTLEPGSFLAKCAADVRSLAELR